MTTGRINQVATIRFEAGSAEAHQHEVRNCVCGISIASLHQFRNCLVPRLRSSVRTSGTGGAAGKAGSAASALRDPISCSEKHRRAALSDAIQFMYEWLKKATIDPYNSKTRAQVIQSRTSWHSMLKQKKRSEPGGSLIKHLLDVT